MGVGGPNLLYPCANGLARTRLIAPRLVHQLHGASLLTPRVVELAHDLVHLLAHGFCLLRCLAAHLVGVQGRPAAFTDQALFEIVELGCHGSLQGVALQPLRPERPLKLLALLVPQKLQRLQLRRVRVLEAGALLRPPAPGLGLHQTCLFLRVKLLTPLEP